ncbi:MAG: histidine kinase [Saccharofermentans sp.]|nr:histidine kinase [Saccharofermentans sp.]
MNSINSTKTKRIFLIFLILNTLMVISGIYLNGSALHRYLNPEYIRDVAIDTMGMLAGSVLLMGLYVENNADKRSRSMFRMIFSLNNLFFMDMLSSFAEGDSSYILAVTIINTLVFMFEDVLGYTYWTYVRNEANLKGKFLNIADKICLAALGISLLFDVLNIKFGYYFTINEGGEYIDAPLEGLGNSAILIFFIMAAIAIFKSTDNTTREKLVLTSFESFPIIAYVFGILTEDYSWTYPAYFLSLLFIYIRVFLERGMRIAEQEVTLTKQSTQLMISQIQPHFLYNVLTTISNLCVTDPEEAEETTVLFSQYLRTNLDSLRNQDTVPFATELGHIKTYVTLEKKRFGDILNVEYDIKEQNFKVPSLGLQPIVENSIKHGIRGKNSPGHIKISTSKVDKGYKIVIEDDGVGFDMSNPVKSDDGRSHVGMNNVRDRLKQMCNATTVVESSPGNGCRTEIIIPE